MGEGYVGRDEVVGFAERLLLRGRGWGFCVRGLEEAE